MKNAVLKVKFEAIGDESSDVAAASLRRSRDFIGQKKEQAE